ncbi:MAG: glutamine--fructose-6-phosphate transaminase (isomerizing) [Chloroflexi bacterium]|nr:glutamine--fructose-6-phosphate transaminase (isomerizing) [Chloroflexota bacterium]MCL5074706.1 glutamine--fructose-6-phosphate transaminase (isomerizing) [Chloroflexota bacterium]
MCGIVGYIGGREATTVVLEGLQHLEYRGYDSAGLAIFHNGRIELRRSVGKLENLRRILESEPIIGYIGIGHTRWATHGKPSESNAHPHIDCLGETVVIHNGIVENYLRLKNQLQAEGHIFRSETDTEVIAHLVEKHCRAGDPLVEAVRKMLSQVSGAHAIVVMSAREPDKIVAARLGHAGGVVIGLGEGEMFIASDAPAILDHTRRMIFLDNREIAVVQQDGVVCLNLEGERLLKSSQIVPWDPIAAAKGGYKHFMLKEIHEQSTAVMDTIRGRLECQPPRLYLEDVLFSPQELRNFEKVTIVACGTAWHAGLIGKFLIEELARLPVEVDYASEFRYRDPLVDERTLLVAVTQSGETVDTLVSMEEAKKKEAKILGVVNVVGSQASRIADALIYTRAGPEIGVASTKAFTAQLVALYLFAVYLGQGRGLLNEDRVRELLQDIAELPVLVGETLARPAEIYEHLANVYFKCHNFLYLGRGINYPVALEGALKLKEISYIHAEGYPAGEMKHGPIALIDELMPVVAIAPRDRVYEKVVNNIQQVKARGGIVISVASDGDEEIREKSDHVLLIPRTSYHLTPVLAVLPLQLLAYYIAVRKGCDVDQPRNLAKSVTVE